MSWNPMEHHRGPFRLQVDRPNPSKGTRAYPTVSTWLTGSVRGEDVAEEATALLTDPRDTITRVYVYSETEQQFVTSFPLKGA